MDDSREKTIKLPFKGLENHPSLYENVLNIEKNYNKDIDLFNAFECVFEVLANKFNGACNETKANLINLAQKHGFKINKKDKISVLGGDKNLPQNLAKILIKEPKLARDLAQKNAKFLQLLSVAKTCRDSQMHAANEVQHLDEKDFGILKDILYFLINKYLRIEFSENNEVKIVDSNNNSMDFDEEFNANLESQQAKERFEFAYKILGNETLKKAQYNEFIVHLSTAFEFILRQKIDDYLQLYRFDFKDKDSLFLYLQNKNIQISSLLDSIKNIHIINAIRLENTTLNALYAVCLSFLDFKEDDRKKIEEIINLRGHGSECRDYDKFCKSSEAKKLFEKFSDFANRLTNHI